MNSTNPHGNWGLARYMGERFKELGFKVRYQRVQFCGAPQANLIARIGPRKGRPLVLNTHLDTVTTRAEDWTQTGGNPFRPTLKGGRLYGLGSADTKLAMACQWIALKSLPLAELKRPIIVTGTYGEEMGLVGVDRLVKIKSLKGADVLNSEPTEMLVALGNKGFRVYHIAGREKIKEQSGGVLCELQFKGRASHSAALHLGKSANLNFLRWLKQQRADLAVLSIDGGHAANIVPPLCTATVLLQSGGVKELKKYSGKIVSRSPVGKTTFYPGIRTYLKNLLTFLKKSKSKAQTQNLGELSYQWGRLEILLDHRFPPKQKTQTILRDLKKTCQAPRGQRRSTYNLKIIKDNAPYLSSSQSTLVKTVQGILKKMKKPARTVIKPGCTEAGHFARIGCEALTVGPGMNYGNIHQPNEFIRTKELEEAVEFYRRVIKEMCF